MTEKKKLTIVIIGATSAIAVAYARHMNAKNKVKLVLVGRNSVKLAKVAQDLSGRGADDIIQFTARIADPGAVNATLADIKDKVGSIGIVLLAFGEGMPDTEIEPNLVRTADMLTTNFVANAVWAEACSAVFVEQCFGHLIILGSVAGDRGRPSNYLYGASKSGLECVAQGLTTRFHGNDQIFCTLIKPGLVDTPMTDHMSKNGPLWSSPERIAQVIATATHQKKAVAYAPWYWFWIMQVIARLPSAVVRKLKL